MGGVLQPRSEDGRAIKIAGLKERYAYEAACKGIPLLWAKFGLMMDGVPGRVGKESYGVCCPCEQPGTMEYISGVEVASLAGLPPEFGGVELPARRYAVFTHHDPVNEIPETMTAIWKDWLPTSGLKAANAPCFEKYGANFDAKTGTGDIEIWLPIES